MLKKGYETLGRKVADRMQKKSAGSAETASAYVIVPKGLEMKGNVRILRDR